MNEPEFENEFGDILRDLDVDSNEPCPPVATLVALQEKRLSGVQLEVVGKHVEGCGVCRSLLDRIGDSGIDEVDDVTWARVAGRLGSRVRPWKRKSVRLSSIPYLRVAAAVALLVVVGLGFWSNRQAQQRRVSTTRGEAIQLLRPEGIVSAVSTLEWSSPPVATLFRVIVSGEWGEESFQSSTSSFRLPASLRDRLTAGKEYRWRVEALDEGGRVILKSDWARFRIQAP